MTWDDFFRLPDIKLFMGLSLSAIIISIIAIYLVKLFVPLDVRYKDNGIIGNASSLISVIYGVLAGLTALYLFNNNGDASDAVLKEANAVANIYRDARWLPKPVRDDIQSSLKSYVQKVIDIEWPLMAKGQDINNSNGDVIIDHIFSKLSQYNVVGNTQIIIFQDMLTEIKALHNARQQRIQMNSSELSPEIWIVIFLGTVLTLCINYLFGMNFYLHVVTVSAAALITTSMIFLLITLERPFQGEFVVEPNAFQSLYAYIEKNTG